MTPHIFDRIDYWIKKVRLATFLTINNSFLKLFVVKIKILTLEQLLSVDYRNRLAEYFQEKVNISYKLEQPVDGD